MSLNRREMLRLGAYGAAGAIISTAASSSVLPSLALPGAADPLSPIAPQPQAPAQVLTPAAPGGIDPQLFARAKAALDQHRVYARDTIGIVDFSKPSSEGRFHVVDLRNGTVESHLVAHGRGSDPDH
ncbi:MAG TPA: murein L,D-transpeptidase catalytic domain family protein, partial [Dongiaceae bacterium]|nr:murein L,D-transpeptidase catalytic domain family protein [Dongiaceae bacterium]